MEDHQNRPKEASTIGVLCVLAAIIMLVLKAAGMDIPWGVVTCPLWGRMAYVGIVEALGLGKGK